MSNPRFARVRAVTLSVLKLEKGVPRFLFFVGPMYEGKKIDDKKEAATLIHSIDMETGEEGVIIVPTVLKKELHENYPGDTYAQRGFEVVITRDMEKKYNHVSINEVTVPDDFERPTAAASAGAPAKTAAKASK
jgi:hypothetical protein